MNPLDTSDSLTNDPFLQSDDSASPETIRISRIEEQLQVSTKTIEMGRVTLTKTVQEREQTVTIPLLSEQYTIERTKLDQFVDEVPSPRQEGNTTIYPVVEEVLVVQKRLRLVEEVRVTKQQVSSTHQETVILRREEIAVERTTLLSSPERADSFDESANQAPRPDSEPSGGSSL